MHSQPPIIPPQVNYGPLGCANCGADYPHKTHIACLWSIRIAVEDLAERVARLEKSHKRRIVVDIFAEGLPETNNKTKR